MAKSSLVSAFVALALAFGATAMPATSAAAHGFLIYSGMAPWWFHRHHHHQYFFYRTHPYYYNGYYNHYYYPNYYRRPGIYFSFGF